MAINIKPLGERVVVKPIEEQNKSLGSILLPEKSKEKSNQGEVIAVGKQENEELKVGNKVLYSKYSGTEIEFDNEKFLILEKKDILAII
jgi:chaperonin GroES